MLALQCNPKLGKLRLIEVPVPTINNPDDVLIRVSYAGLCGTDLHILSGEFTNSASDYVTICHEFSGVVESVGDVAAKLFQPGDRVGVDPNRPCQVCKYCRKAQVHHCQTQGPKDGTGVFRNGGMAKFCLVPADQVHKLHEDVNQKLGALCEPLSCILQGWKRLNMTPSLDPSSRILVVGAGIIGNLWSALLHHNGYKNVTVSEPSAGRRAIAARLETGYKIITPDELAKGEIGVDDEMDGFDVVIETSGFPPALQQAIGMTSKGATVMIFGCAPAGKTIQLSPEEVFRKELSIIGSLINPATYSTAINLARNMGERYLDYERLGIAVYSIQDYEEAISCLKRGEVSKAIFKIDQ